MRHHTCHCGAHMSSMDAESLAAWIISHDRDVHHIEHEIEEIEEKLDILIGKKAVTSSVVILNSKGEIVMDGTVHINDPAGIAVYQELDAQGNKVPPVGAVAFSSDTPTVATVDPVTGQLAYVSVGKAIISASDAGNFPASATLTVIASVAVTSVLTVPNTAAPTA